MQFLQTPFLGNSLQNWLIALLIVAATFVGVLLLRIVLCRQLERRHEGENALWPVLAAVVRRTAWLPMLILALFLGSFTISMPDKLRTILNSGVIIVLLVQAGLWFTAALRVSVELYRQRQISKDPASVTTLNLLNFIGRVTIWTLVILLSLDNLGVNITALVAGLGVGGIAVALALQTILGDLFSSLSIALDKPFVVGDFLVVNDLMGSVEYVGLKTTRLRSLSGEQLVFSNSDLLKSRIRNFGRMFERRVPFNLGVTYQTPRDKLKLIPQIIREGIEQQAKTRFDRSNFKEFGNSALVFETVYYVLGPDYNEYMNIQEAINLHIHERFEAEGIEFAYPTQTLFVQQQP